MIRVEDLQDLDSLGLYEQMGINTKKYDNWIKEIFEECSVDEADQKILSVLLGNLKHSYMNSQEKGAKIEDGRIHLLRKMCIYELVYHYQFTWSMRHIIGMQPMTQPAGLVYFKDGNKTKNAPVSVRTDKSERGVGGVFLSIQNDIVEKVYSNLDEPDEVAIEDLRDYLDEQKHNKLAFNSQFILDANSFEPMISNAAVVRMFKDFDKKIIEVNGCIPEDEILLIKSKSMLDIGACVCPCLIPIYSSAVDGRSDLGFMHAMGRYGLWISDNIKDHYKRVKVIA